MTANVVIGTNYGGTGSVTSQGALANLGIASPVGNSGKVLQSNGTVYTAVTPNAGTVTAVTGTGNIASTGGATPQISLTGAVSIANGGTGSVTKAAAFNALAPVQSNRNGSLLVQSGNTAVDIFSQGNAGEVLVSAGSNANPVWTPRNKIYTATFSSYAGFPIDGPATGKIDYAPSASLLSVLQSSLQGTVSFVYMGQFTIGNNTTNLPLKFSIGTNVSIETYTPPYATLFNISLAGATICSPFVIRELSTLGTRANISEISLYVRNENTGNNSTKVNVNLGIPQTLYVTISPDFIS